MADASGLSQVVAAIDTRDNFLITAHIHPDGDSVGSMLALAWALERLGKRVQRVLAERVPLSCQTLPGVEKIANPSMFPPGTVFPNAIVLDCGDLDRIGSTQRLFGPSTFIILVDHHLNPRSLGHVSWFRPEAAATGEMVYDLIQALGVPLNHTAATCLYTSILTDTGGFRYSNTTPRVVEMAAALLRLGVDGPEAARQAFETRSLEATRLLAEVLRTLQVSADGRLAYLILTREMLRKYHTDASETEGFVNYARAIVGVEIAALFREEEEDGRLQVRVSLRSRGHFNVHTLAAAFGGGGHAKAAGCTLPGPLSEAVPQVLSKAESLLNGGGVFD